MAQVIVAELFQAFDCVSSLRGMVQMSKALQTLDEKASIDEYRHVTHGSLLLQTSKVLDSIDRWWKKMSPRISAIAGSWRAYSQGADIHRVYVIC